MPAPVTMRCETPLGACLLLGDAHTLRGLWFEGAAHYARTLPPDAREGSTPALRDAAQWLGDYFAGPNHVLPTNGTAKFFSPLGVDAYVKKSSIIYYSKKALKPVSKDIIQFAESEYLTAHANSIRVRFDQEEE